MLNLKRKIHLISDFPKKGVLFRDITPLLLDSKALDFAIEKFLEFCKGKKIDKIVGIESRGFILGAILADRLKVGFIPIRKSGKLPAKKLNIEYTLEYDSQSIEIHQDSIKKGEKILIVDDLLATGGTAKAACDLVKKLKGEIVGLVFLIELLDLKGREKIKEFPILSLIKY
jgi:adenine phosphoribosyltransferase